MSCDFSVAVRLIASDGSTVLLDFDDDAAGLAVETCQEPDENVREVRVTAPRVDGGFRVAEAYDEGVLVLVVRCTGSTWAQCSTRWQAARTAYRSESFYFLETVIEGVTTRYRTERPNVTPAGMESENLVLKEQTYSLRFTVQPSPTVTIA